MIVKELIPILNVSNIEESFAWFERLGWKQDWVWGEPPGFGAVVNGNCQIFLCLDGQGSRGGPMPRHVRDDDTGGVWMSWFLSSPAEVDETFELVKRNGVIVTRPPTDEEWGVREFHIRHPDGHIFRVGSGLGDDEDD